MTFSTIIKAIVAWFTPARRQSIYAAVAAFVPILVGLRVFGQSEADALLTIATVVLQLGSAILLLVNLRPSEAGEWFLTAGRGTLYALAALAAPAAVTLGWITNDQSASALTAISTGLTVLASVVGIVFAKTNPATPSSQ